MWRNLFSARSRQNLSPWWKYLVATWSRISFFALAPLTSHIYFPWRVNTICNCSFTNVNWAETFEGACRVQERGLASKGKISRLPTGDIVCLIGLNSRFQHGNRRARHNKCWFLFQDWETSLSSIYFNCDAYIPLHATALNLAPEAKTQFFRLNLQSSNYNLHFNVLKEMFKKPYLTKQG